MCGACCRYVSVLLREPRSKGDYSTLFWYLLHEDVSVCIDGEGDWFVEFSTSCEALDGNRCSIHGERPSVCRDHDPGDCEGTTGGQPYAEVFHSPEDLERYLDGAGVDFRYRRGGY